MNMIYRYVLVSEKLYLKITHDKKRKHIPIIYNHQPVYLTKGQFNRLGKSNAKRGLSKFLSEETDRIEGILSKMTQFNIEKFMKLYSIPQDLHGAFKEKEEELRANGKLSRAKSYASARRSMPNIKVRDISETWVRKYIDSKDFYPSAYLNCLRSLCNSHGNYVFKDIKIRTRSKTKIPLSPESLAIFRDAKMRSYNEDKFRDIWMIGYYTGINTKGIVFLKKEHIQKDFIRKDRLKTGEPLVIPIDQRVHDLIDKHRRANGDYVFQFVSFWLSREEQEEQYHKFLCNMYRNLKNIQKRLEIPEKITPYVSRHTHANTLLDAGLSLEQIKDSLGHASIKSTEVYARSLNLKNKKKRLDLL